MTQGGLGRDTRGRIPPFNLVLHTFSYSYTTFQYHIMPVCGERLLWHCCPLTSSRVMVSTSSSVRPSTLAIFLSGLRLTWWSFTASLSPTGRDADEEPTGSEVWWVSASFTKWYLTVGQCSLWTCYATVGYQYTLHRWTQCHHPSHVAGASGFLVQTAYCPNVITAVLEWLNLVWVQYKGG